MKVKLIMLGKTKERFINEGFELYRKRIVNYLGFDAVVVPALKNTKNLSPDQVKEQEGQQLLKHISQGDFTVLLDENGRSFDSVGFAGFVQQRMNAGIRTLNFVIGGAWGFSEEVYRKADLKISLSPLTFSHQIVRLVFMEQLYRAMTILRNEPYHNA